MIDIEECLLRFSVISLVLCFLRSLRKKIWMGLSSRSKKSSSGPPHPRVSSFFIGKESVLSSKRFANSKRQVIFASDHPQEKENITLEKKDIIQEASCSEGIGSMPMEASAMTEGKNVPAIKPSIMSRKRPAQLILPPTECPSSDFAQMGRKLERKELHVEGRCFSLASKKGRREVMEDGHGVMLDISGNPKQVGYKLLQSPIIFLSFRY